jgi:excisionase family DNA binding protein
MSLQDLLSPNQVAVLLRVSPVTVRHWSLDGKLKFVLTPGGHRRYAYADIERFAREHSVQLSRSNSTSLRILVVDDNVALAEYIMELLNTEVPDVYVEIAHDGFSAGEKLHTLHPHVVLLDLMMPGLNGFETCRRIKQHQITRDVRVIAMTGYPSEENIQRILAEGADVCLAKPVRAPALLLALGIDSKSGTNKKLSNV